MWWCGSTLWRKPRLSARASSTRACRDEHRPSAAASSRCDCSRALSASNRTCHRAGGLTDCGLSLSLPEETSRRLPVRPTSSPSYCISHPHPGLGYHAVQVDQHLREVALVHWNFESSAQTTRGQSIIDSLMRAAYPVVHPCDSQAPWVKGRASPQSFVRRASGQAPQWRGGGGRTRAPARRRAAGGAGPRAPWQSRRIPPRRA